MRVRWSGVAGAQASRALFFFSVLVFMFMFVSGTFARAA